MSGELNIGYRVRRVLLALFLRLMMWSLNVSLNDGVSERREEWQSDDIHHLCYAEQPLSPHERGGPTPGNPHPCH